MRWLILLIFLVGCSADHVQLAETYKQDLQYYEYAVGFAKKGMVDEAVERCEYTSTLRSECFTSLVQHMAEKGQDIPQYYCDQISVEKINMTKKAFRYVYPATTPELEQEIKEKLNPGKMRTETVQKVKQLC